MKSAKVLAVIPPAATEEERLIDEFGELQRKVLAFKPTLDRYEHARAKLQASLGELRGDHPACLYGQLYEVQVSMAQQQRHITDMAKVFKAMGKVAFLQACTIPLKALEATFGEVGSKAYTKWKYTGPRKYVAVLREAAGPKPAA